MEFKKLISEKLNYYNQIYFIDLHSFGLDYGADMILGNDFGKTCSASLMSFIEHKLMERGYSVKQKIIHFQADTSQNTMVHK